MENHSNKKWTFGGMEVRRSYVVTASIALAVLIVVLGLWSAVRQGVFNKEAPVGEPQEISSRNTLKGLPDGLIQERDAIKSGEKINYEGESVQYSVSYMSAKSIEENIRLFREYIMQNDWRLLEDASMPKGPIPYFYATKEDQSENLNVSFMPINDKIQVTIGYFKK